MSLLDDFEALDGRAIEDFVREGQEEYLQLDFKTTASPDFSNRDDRKLLAIAVSGFANSAGGIIVWGISTAREGDLGADRADQIVRLAQHDVFLGRLNTFTSQAASPIVDGIRHRLVQLVDNAVVALTLVPASDSTPHMAKLGENRYYKRSGDSFRMMEHFDLEDMFGRRPKAKLEARLRVRNIDRQTNDNKLVLIVSIENTGRSTAVAPFIEFRLPDFVNLSSYGLDGNRNHGLPRVQLAAVRNRYQFGGDAGSVIHPGTTRDVTCVSAQLRRGPFDVEINGYLCSSNSMKTDFIVRFTAAQMADQIATLR